jgi:uncharacterized membrane protein
MNLNFLSKYNNVAGYIAFANLAFSLVLAIAYLFQKDYRRALYFFFAFCITATIVL